jgi:hypothetical protein
MITGYNTDVRYREKVLHVQTEDKGIGNPFIESVVYFGGQVVVSKRAGYSDLVSEGKGAEEISARMDHQHRMMIAAIRAGRLDGKLRELWGDAVLGPTGDATVAASVPESGQPAATSSSPLLDATRDDSGPSLDQVILDYLNTEGPQDQLELTMEANGISPGATCHVGLRATSARSGLPVAGAVVTVKMISTVRDPMVLGNGTTDDEGRLALSLAIPAQERGMAAIIVTASSLLGSAEIKHFLD